MPVKKLTYFTMPGRGELLRMIFHASNEKFEDERLSNEQWAALKPSTKYGQLPLLTIENGAVMNESMAIARYLARKSKLYGKDEWEMYLVDRALDTMNDLFTKLVLSIFEKDPKRKEELEKELKEKHTGHYLDMLTKYIEEGKGEFFTGSSPTMADISLIQLLDYFKEARPKFPKLDNNYKKTVAAFPGLKKYIESRPAT